MKKARVLLKAANSLWLEGVLLVHYEVDTASDVEKALTKLDSQTYDVVLDFCSSVADEIISLGRIFEKHPEERVIFISNSSPSAEEVRDAFNRGVIDFVTPLDATEILNSVKKALARPKGKYGLRK